METRVASKQPQWLEKPVRLSEQKWPEGTKPVVSIFCLTYNHEKFIRDALEGFLMQETTFPVEIFVHDDASKDKTQSVLNEYKAKHPDLVRLVLQKDNHWSKYGNRHFIRLVASLQGKYVAFCEGDDYWISKKKLQQQIVLLENHPEASGSYHLIRAIRDGNAEFTYPKGNRLKKLQLEDVLEEITAHTCSLCLRKGKAWERLGWSEGLTMGDWPIVAEHAAEGPLLPVPGVHAHYRLHPAGLWMGRNMLSRLVETERFHRKAFKIFSGRVSGRAWESRKENLLGIFKLAYADKQPLLALWAISKYLLCKPKRFFFPEKQKRALVYAFSFGLFCTGGNKKY